MGESESNKSALGFHSGGRPSWPTQQKNQVASFILGALDDLDKGGGIERSSGWIEEDFAAGRMPFEQVKASRYDLPHFAAGISGGALDELGGDGIRVLVARFPYEIDEDLYKS